MRAIQGSAELAVRNLFKRLLNDDEQSRTISATDYMDDGNPISLQVHIKQDGSAIFDFTGTGPEVLGKHDNN